MYKYNSTDLRIVTIQIFWFAIFPDEDERVDRETANFEETMEQAGNYQLGIKATNVIYAVNIHQSWLWNLL